MAGRKRDGVLRTGEVTVEKGDKIYTARYEFLRGGFVRLYNSGSSTYWARVPILEALRAESLARLLLNQAIHSGLADREGWGRPKTEAS